MRRGKKQERPGEPGEITRDYTWEKGGLLGESEESTTIPPTTTKKNPFSVKFKFSRSSSANERHSSDIHISNAKRPKRPSPTKKS